MSCDGTCSAKAFLDSRIVISPFCVRKTEVASQIFKQNQAFLTATIEKKNLHEMEPKGTESKPLTM